MGETTSQTQRAGGGIMNQPGGVFGELSIADGGPRSADAETLEACQLLHIPREAVQEICQRVPSVAQALTSSLAATLRRLTEAASEPGLHGPTPPGG